MSHLAGIDIGGTKVDYLLFSDKFRIIKKNTFKTNKIGGGSLRLLDFLLNQIKKEKKLSFAKIGISINAAVKQSKILKSSVLGVENFPLGKYIEKVFKKTEVIVENDVISSAKAEISFGYGKTYKKIALLNIGTGTHVTYCNNGEVISGYNNVGGEISQTKIFLKDMNKTFLLDDLISGRGISNIYKHFTNESVEARQIFLSKNNQAKKTIEIFKKKLAYLFELIAYFYNPEALILTGSVFKSSEFFLDEVYMRFKKNNFNFFHFKLFRSKLKYANITGTFI